MFPAKAEPDTAPFWFQVSDYKQVSSQPTIECCGFVCVFVWFCLQVVYFLLVVLPFKMSQAWWELLSSVLEPKKAVMCLREKILALDKISSGTSYSAISQEFNGNESAVHRK